MRGALTVLLLAGLLASCAGNPVRVHFWDPDAPVLPLLTRSSSAQAPEAVEPQVKQYVVLLPEADGSAGELTVTEGETATVLTEAYQAVGFGELPEVYRIAAADVESRFGPALVHEPAPPASFTVHFLHGSVELTAPSRALLQKVAVAISDRPAPEVWIEGYADSSGSAERNLDLSRARAEAIRTALVGAGLAAGVIDIEWYGENELAVTTADGVRQPENRRVEIRVR